MNANNVEYIQFGGSNLNDSTTYNGQFRDSIQSINLEFCDSWTCHIHHSSSDRCSIKVYNGKYYHVIPVNNISTFSQSHFNASNVANEHWEDFNTTMYVTPIAYSTCINKFEVFTNVCRIFAALDGKFLKYSTQNTPNDFIKKHIITDGSSAVFLCNTHLIKLCQNKNHKPQIFYTKIPWIRAIVKALYPKTNNPQSVSTSTPAWAIKLLSNTIKK